MLGERKLINLIRSMYSYRWPDSDSAYIDVGDRRILITNDSITRSTHLPSGASMREIGYFFAAINLSDIAAMGGTPKYFMCSLILPSNTDYKDLVALEAGMSKCLGKYGVRIIGGDLKKGKELAMTGIAIGEVKKSMMMQRLRMRKGEALCVTGMLGGNAAGYYLWKRGSRKGASKLIDVEPKIKEGIFLSRNGVRAAMDLSDGVYSSIHQLKEATGLGFEIYYDKLPAAPLAKSVNRKLGVGIEQLCLNFGGEYELLFSVSESRFKELREKAARRKIRISRIGKVTGGRNCLVKGKKRINIRKYGYEHFITN